MNRDKIGSQTCYIHQCTNRGMLMYIACLCPNLVSVHFYAIPILHSKFPKLFIYLLKWKAMCNALGHCSCTKPYRQLVFLPWVNCITLCCFLYGVTRSINVVYK